ncbi:MAG TPA: protein jag [Mycobacteriales bacterium]|jgi:spoIIIJ-associated protein|nr:protein jag [Mycobacteriales bacterium]
MTSELPIDEQPSEDQAAGTHDEAEPSADAGDPAEDGGTESSGTESGSAETDSAETSGHGDEASLLEREGDIAADYLEVLLDIADLDGDIDIDVEGDRAAVSVVGPGLDRLIGTNGSTLDALQELTRLAVHRETGVRSRLMLDVGGHRAQRREDLTTVGTEAAQRVLASGEVERLAPMTPFERKIVHDAVAAVNGVDTESEGDEPDRRVVIRPV